MTTARNLARRLTGTPLKMAQARAQGVKGALHEKGAKVAAITKE